MLKMWQALFLASCLLTVKCMGSLPIKISRKLIKDTKMKNTEKHKPRTGKLPIHGVRVSWKILIVPFGMIVLLWLFSVHIVAGFAGALGLMLGSLGEKLGWWDN